MKPPCKSRSQCAQKRRAALMLEPPGELRFITDTPEAQPDESTARETNKPEPASWNPKWLRWAVLGSVVAIAVLGMRLYAHTLNFPFQFDDHIYLVGSPFVMEMKEFLINR